MGTKERILECALKLFNEKGLENVPTRMISKELQISPGNLTYHFKKKEEIIYALYLQLVNEISIVFQSQLSSELTLKSMFEGYQNIYVAQLKYRFCMIDFVQLMRTQPKIKAHFNELMEFRKIQFSALFQKGVEQGILMPEPFPGLYQMVGLNMSIHGDYWLSHAEVLFPNSNQQALEIYSASSRLLLFPYLTDESKIQFMKLFPLP